MRSRSCVGREPRGVQVVEQRQRDHAVRADGDVHRQVLLAPEEHAQHVLGTDDVPGGGSTAPGTAGAPPFAAAPAGAGCGLCANAAPAAETTVTASAPIVSI